MAGGERVKGPPPAYRPPRMITHRDWLIQVECAADSIWVRSGNRRFPAAELAGRRADDNPLLAFVKQMIDRRQAALPVGEPPYRPQIRFLVRPSGLRTYYQAYPALEALHVPMTRANLDAKGNLIEY